MVEQIIKLENVWKIYKPGEVEFTALKGINLEVNPGSFISIMGPSGSGKSTLLNIIGCLDVPSKGKVFLKGRDISKLSQNELAELRGKTIGFVFQRFNLLGNLTALENVTLPMVFQKTSEKEKIKKAERILSSLGLSKKMDNRPGELSGGEQQRVAVARALANDPEFILADEPTGNLDSFTGKQILEILTSLHQKEKKSLLVVTHDRQIANYSKEIINLKDGELVSNHQTASKSLW